MYYQSLNRYLRSRFGGRIGKICIDGGFSCPNRDGTCSTGGCIFCGERGAGEHIEPGIGISRQVQRFLELQGRHKTADGFIAYFQNFSNTHAPVEVLRNRYEQSLIDPRIVVLAVGTRPDCISEPVAALLSELQVQFRGRETLTGTYSPLFQTWVELGLQTENDETARLINRGYASSVFTNAVGILNRWNLPVVVHLIVGLPGESFDDLKRTVDFVNQHRIWGIKIHSLYVSRDTKLAELYRQKTFEPISQEEYVERTVYVLTHVSPELVVHRLTGDCSPDRLIAPDWIADKNQTILHINNCLESSSWRQGTFYG